MLLGLSFFQIPELLKSAFKFFRHIIQDVDDESAEEDVLEGGGNEEEEIVVAEKRERTRYGDAKKD